ncbi:substrate-binding domain-containing protein [Oscillospiraceae bacterium MB08-C2-2]|nr:substrate-binding domain-containing protein [Oscillospiraceae bacterium MB08-C2-2]
MIKTRKVLSLVLVVVFITAIALTGCGGSSSGSSAASSAAPASSAAEAASSAAPADSTGGRKGVDTPISAGISVKTMSNPFFARVRDAVEEELLALNPENKLASYDSLQDVNKELSNVEDMIAQKMDVIFLTAIDLEGSVAAVDKVSAAGIPIVLLDSGIKGMDKKATFTVISDNMQAGRLTMQAIADALDGKGKIVIYENSLSAAVSDRMKGRDEILAKYPDIEVVNRQNGPGQIDKAMEVMNNFLQSDPDAVAVWAMNDPSAQGCVAAIKGAGKKPGEILVTGIDGASDSIKLINEGYQLGTASQFPSQIGKIAVEEAVKYINGEQISAQDIRIPTEWIDSEKAKTFVADY